MIKVVTGIRRCGKSSLLKFMVQHLLENGVEKSQILEINFASYDFKKMSVDELYAYVKNRIVPSWEDAINSFRVDFDCDIYYLF